MKVSIKLLSLYCFLSFFFTNAQLKFKESEVKDYYTGNLKQVYELWKNYIHDYSKTGQIDPKYWIYNESKIINGVDLVSQEEFNPSLYSFNINTQILYIKEIEKFKYKIHTIFYWISEDNSLNIMAEADYMAIKDGNDFKLSNFLFHSTKNWKVKKVGNITYHHFPEYKFNYKKAYSANKRIERLSQLFDLPNKKINYYIFKDCNQSEEYRGFSYLPTKYLVKSCGFYNTDNDFLYTNSFEGENYAHEIMHIINEKYNNSHYIILSGLAIYNNQKRVHLGYSFFELFNKFNDYLTKHNPSNIDLIKGIKFHNSIQTYYLMGAIIVDILLDSGGLDLLKKSMQETKTDEELLNFLYKNTDIKQENINLIIKSKVKELSSKNFKFKINL